VRAAIWNELNDQEDCKNKHRAADQQMFHDRPHSESSGPGKASLSSKIVVAMGGAARPWAMLSGMDGWTIYIHNGKDGEMGNRDRNRNRGGRGGRDRGGGGPRREERGPRREGRRDKDSGGERRDRDLGGADRDRAFDEGGRDRDRVNRAERGDDFGRGGRRPGRFGGPRGGRGGRAGGAGGSSWVIWIVLLIIVGVAIWYFFLRDTGDDAEALAAVLATAVPFAFHARPLED
jgi:hypothetical protein